MTNNDDITKLIRPVAEHFWGKPTTVKQDELRFGQHGSKAISLTAGTWYDFELGVGGGVTDLIKNHVQNISVSEFLKTEFNYTSTYEPEIAINFRPSNNTVYKYLDENKVEQLYVTRLPDKRFIQTLPDGRKPSQGEYKIVPYKLPELLEASHKTIFICEGEKDVHTLIDNGFTATTNAGGSQNWREEHAKYLHGRKCIIIPDNDEAGLRWSQQVIKTLFGKASLKLVQLPNLKEKGDVSDWFEENTREDLKTIAKNTKLLDRPETPIPILTLKQITEMEPIPWLVDGILPEQSLAMLYGQSGSGKTFLAMHLLSCIAHGISFFNKAVNQGSVVLVAGEGVGGLRKRVIAWHEHHNLETSIPLYVIPRSVNIMDSQEISDLITSIELVTDSHIKLIVIDTLARAMMGEGDENSTQAMSQAITQLDRLREHFKACVMPVHHTGKADNRGARGSSALVAAVDVSLFLKRTDEEFIEVTTEKQKDAEAIPPLFLKSKRVKFQVDALSDMESSVILEEASSEKTKPKKKLTEAQDRALEALRTALIEKGSVPSGNDITWACVTEEQWRETALGMVISDTSEGANKKAFKRAADALMQKKIVAMVRKLVWIIDAD